MSLKHRCRECTLLRVEYEGMACEECVANGASAYPLTLPNVYENSATEGSVMPQWYQIWVAK